MKKGTRRRNRPYKIAKLKTPITHVEVAREDTLGRILIFAGNLSGWISQDDVIME